MTDQEKFSLSLDLLDGFRFEVDFGTEGLPRLVVDEPPPIGSGSGPNGSRVLGAAVGACLSASLLFCLKKARIDVHDLHCSVEGSLVRNDEGRLRIGMIRVQLEPRLDAEQVARIARCREIFEDFCIVTQSVRQGIDVEVDLVTPAAAEA
jgi:organic hydroperoxide reductase OsmC/OhrA